MTRATARSYLAPSAASNEHAPSDFEQAMHEKMTALKLPGSFAAIVRTTYREIARALLARNAQAENPLVVGLCGCQGSGKSTLAAFLKLLLDWKMQSTAILSLDDFYMT